MSLTIGAVLLLLFTSSCSQSQEQPRSQENMEESIVMSEAPIPERREHTETHHGYELSDPYHWLKDQSYPTIDDKDVLAYLQAENAYFEEFAEALKDDVDYLYDELVARMESEDVSVPYVDGDYVYQSRFTEGKEYRQHVRWETPDGNTDPGSLLDVPEKGVELILDQNELAEGHEYFRLGAFSISPNHRMLAYSTDTDGSEEYTMQIKDIEKNEILPEKFTKTMSGVVWAADEESFLYVLLDDNWRPRQVKHHVLGTDPKDDAVVYEEEDPGFFIGIGRTTSRKYAIISTGNQETSEVRIIPLFDLTSPPTLVRARETGHEYSIDHGGGDFFILTNDTHKNYRLATAPEDSITESNWESVIEGSDSRFITNFQAQRERTIVSYREEGMEQVGIYSDQTLIPLQFDEAVYSVGFGSSSDPDPSQLRIYYSSLVTPSTTFDYDFATGERYVRKVQKIPSGHDPENYKSERRMAPSHDGVMVPVSIVYHKDTQLDGSAPLFLRSYGAYGASSSPRFSTSSKTLTDRGFVYAIAHIRGGSEMGRHWYEDGKLDKRRNTFWDFIAVAQYLIEENFTSSKKIAITGGSAGGTLMGVVANEAPELWGAVVSQVPFVDVLNTMMDTSLPLTPIEWPEWGDPIKDKSAFEYIRSYSPYDQIEAKDYPPMLVTAGLNDPRVTYWEPAKYVAKLRHLKTDDNFLFLKTEMGAGHGGQSGRFQSLVETAETYAFIFHTLDIDVK